MCMCDMAQSPTCSLCCSKKEQMRLNQWQSNGSRHWKQRYVHIYCLFGPLRITEASTNKPAVLQLSSHLCSTTLEVVPTIPGTHAQPTCWKLKPLIAVGFTESAACLIASVSNGQRTLSSWDRCAVWDQQVINYLIWLSHICCND